MEPTAPLERLHITESGYGEFVAEDGSPQHFLLRRALNSARAAAAELPEEERPNPLSSFLAPRAVVTLDVCADISTAEHPLEEYRITAREFEMLEQRAEELGSPGVDRNRVIKARWSAQTPNRSNIVVRNRAWDFTEFRRNPVGLFNHQSGGMLTRSSPRDVVSRWLEVGHAGQTENSDLIGYPEFVPPNIHADGDVVLGLYRFRAMNAFSPGFMPNFETIEVPSEGPDLIINGAELYELSHVMVPRHPAAIQMALKADAFSLESLRGFVDRQLEAAYGQGAAVLEFAQLEALGKALGVVEPKTLITMSAEELAGLRPAEPEAKAPSGAEVLAALESGERLAAFVDDAAWEKFATFRGLGAALELSSPDTAVRLAEAAGIDPELVELARGALPADEPPPVAPEEPPAEFTLERAEEPAEEPSWPETDTAAIANQITAAVEAAARELVERAENTLGIVAIPARRSA